MEENNILNKNNKKKILIGSIIIVLVLLLVVVGSTYAYFSLQVNGEGTSTKVTITTGSSKQIKLSGGLEDFHIKLDVKDMAYNRQGDYYATSDSKLPYVTNKEEGLTEIGKVEVIGELEEKHVCTAKAKVNLSGDMASLIREGDLEISLINGIYTNITDLTKINEKFPAELEFVITDTSTHYIQAYLKFTNRNDDQSYLAKKSLNVDIIIDEFECNTDSEAPTASEFYFNEKVDGQQYTNSLENILHLSWSDNDVTDYCITTNDNYEGCQWKPTNGQQSIQENITLEEREGDHTYYAYLKDKIGNISTQVTASIIYDKTLPTINSFYIKENKTPKYTNQIKNTVYYTYSDNNIKDICVTEDLTSDSCNWQAIGTSIDYTFTNNNEEAKTIYGYVRDKANNISNTQVSDTITYDRTAPTISSITNVTIGETSVTLKANANTDLSGIDKYCYSTSNSDIGTCVTSTDGNITISNLQDGKSYTYYFYLTDNAGNSGISNKTQHTFETESSGIKGQDLINDRTNIPNLQDTPVDGLYRYYGNYDVVNNNYICIGGPLNSETCGSADNNKYLYRIIGVTDGKEKSTLGLDAGMLKVIKVIPTNTSQAWSANSDIDWDNDNNKVRTQINGEGFYNSLDAGIQNIIPAVKWWKGDRTNATSSGVETKTATTGSYQIGLMYAGDYYNSWTYATNTDSWLHITHTMSGKTTTYKDTYEWTMTRYGYGSYGYYLAWGVEADGTLYNTTVVSKRAVRPVFYLPSTVKLTGEGTEGNPFIINS